MDTPLVRTLDFNAETSSVHKFYADYTTQSGVTFLELLANEYASRSTPCFFAALDATAMASSARQLRQSGLMNRARQAYGKAISGIRHAIQDESLIKEDSVLISLFVLGLFQVQAVHSCVYRSIMLTCCRPLRESSHLNRIRSPSQDVTPMLVVL